MMDEIRTERLLLRRARMEDAAAMHAIMSDPVAMRDVSVVITHLEKCCLGIPRQWAAGGRICAVS